MSLFALKMRACVVAIVAATTLPASPVVADIVGTFDSPNVNVIGTTSVQTISFDVGNVADIAFEANFVVIDAGIQINVNGTPLFVTPEDVTQFGTPNNIFVSTPSNDSNGAAFDNLGFAFNPLPGDLPRLTVTSDNTGTSFTGYNQVNGDDPPLLPPTAVTYTTSFTPQNFSSLLNPNSLNTIEIFNINNDTFARLAGDFTLTGELVTVPEPSAVSLLLFGGLALVARRRR